MEISVKLGMVATVNYVIYFVNAELKDKQDNPCRPGAPSTAPSRSVQEM